MQSAWIRLSVFCVVALTAVVCADAAAAGAPSNRWLHFMGTDADAHAIDLASLHVLGDGLLRSATRYPRTSSADWTPAQNQAGYYEYIQRLTDCHTGLSIDTSISLLDQDNRVVATRPYDRDHQVEQVALRWDEVARRKWPDNSEIWLACAAAAQPGAIRDGHLPDSPESWYFDVAKIGAAPPSTTRGVFEALRAQYDAHLAGFLALVSDALLPRRGAPQAAASTDERWHKVDVGFRTERIDVDSLRANRNGVIEYTARARGDGYPSDIWPKGVPEDAWVDTRYMADCRNGLTLAVEQTFRAGTAGGNQGGEDAASAGKVLSQRPTSVLTTLNRLSGANGLQSGLAWSQWHGPQHDDGGPAAYMCRRAARRCGASVPAHPFEIDPAKLADKPGAPLLVSARTQWLQYRATFVPSCFINPGKP